MLVKVRKPLLRGLSALTSTKSLLETSFLCLRNDAVLLKPLKWTSARNCIAPSCIRSTSGYISTCNRLNHQRYMSTSPLKTEPRGKIKMAGDTDGGWLKFDKFRVYPWALSGLESSIVVEADHFKDRLAFDVGYAHRASVRCKHVFITHGHMDHTSGIVSHWSKRNLVGANPSTYYVPPNLNSKLKHAVSLFHTMNEGSEEILECPINIQSISPNDDVTLPGGLIVRPFDTKHRVPSQGYLVYKNSRQLKNEYAGLDGKELQKLHTQGVEIRKSVITPEVAYTGDTTFEVFRSLPNPDILKVKLLIVESTYIDNEIRNGEDGKTRARNRGHLHLQEIVDNEHLFSEVENIVLVHFSDKYSVGYIRRRVDEIVPQSLRQKIHLGLVQKESRI